MQLGLNGRTALVTGGSRGIGFGTARILASEGCHLHLASRNAQSLAEAKRRITEVHKVDVTCHALDLASSETVRKLAAACGDVDILVNNAGAIPQGSVTALDEKTWRDAWDLKVFGFINLTREIYRNMCERRSGVIVNVHWRELTKGFPFGRLGTVDEVVNMIAFLCSDLSSYTTGAVITIDGGATGR